MVGILCEKPSAARNFAAALGGMKGIYNGVAYQIVNARGHLYEYADPEDMVEPSKKEKYKSWAVTNLPWREQDLSWKRVRKKGVSDTIASIKAGLSSCDEVVIATDNDPSGEGDLLAYEIIEDLHMIRKRISRMYFLDETVSEIQKAFENRKIISDFYNHPEYRKALYRSKFDYLSMQFTRIATACGDGESMIRQGRLKSAMVSIVGDQLKAISEYKKVPFYCNKFCDENKNIYTNPDEPKFSSKEQVPRTYTASVVVLDSTERKAKAPKKLLDLASLSALLAPKGYKAKQVLDIYQEMYEAQIVSYPRTEDKTITNEQFNDLLPLVDKIAAVVNVDSRLLTHRTPRATHVKAGGAHGANRPGPNVPNSLNELSMKYGMYGVEIYMLLARSYLAMLAEDYVYDFESGHLQKYPSFKGTAHVPVSMGWKLIFKDDDEEEVSNHLGTMAKPFVYEGFPPKPTAPTMKWLMTQLAKYDVGTGATRTSTYADVTSEKSKYPLLVDKKGKIMMAECGEMSYKLLPNTHIGSVSLTEEMQQNMNKIAAHELTIEQCLACVADYVREDLKTMTDNGQTITKKAGSNGMATEKEKCVGVWNGQNISFTRSWGGHRFTDEECEALLRGETISVYGLQSAKGTTYGVKGKLAKQTYRNATFIGFEKTEFLNDPQAGMPKVWCGHRFSDEEYKKLEAGEEIMCCGFKSRTSGKVFDASVRYDESKGKFVFNFN